MQGNFAGGDIFINFATESSSADKGEKPPEIADRGLLPFNLEDRALFARLERGPELRRVLAAVLDPGYRFGLLVAPSGAGKTSFLRAGLLAQLRAQEGKIPAIYVEISDEDPCESIDREVRRQGMPRPSGILLLDQFEQFFLHQRLPEQRHPLIDRLVEWYKPGSGVKVLIAIRAEDAWQMIEIQERVNYRLSNQDYFKLTKFTPEQAVTVLGVLCEAAKLPFDEDVVDKVVQRDLCDPEDGLVSPVNLGIVIHVLSSRKGSDRSFQGKEFNARNGINGLLEDWLNSQLDVAKAQRLDKEAISVLTAFCDLENDRRAGILTTARIEKERPDLKPEQVRRAVEWLSGRDVRLIAPAGEGADGYQLSHERFIPAIRKAAGKLLDAAAKANALLNRRVADWVNNDRSSRFLLRLGEYWRISRQRRYILWGGEQQNKEELLAFSRKRLEFQGIGAGLCAFLCIGAYLGYVEYTNSPSYQIDRMVNMVNQVQETSDNSLVSGQLHEWCGLLTLAGRVHAALQTAGMRPDNDHDKINAYIMIEKVAVRSNRLNEAFQAAAKTRDSKWYAYNDIALVMARANRNPEHAFALAMEAASKTPYALSAYINIASGKVEAHQDPSDALTQAMQAAGNIPDGYSNKPGAYIDVATAMAKARQDPTNAFALAIQAARKIGSKEYFLKPATYAAIATAMAKANRDPSDALTQAMKAAKELSAQEKVNAYISIANAMAEAHRDPKNTFAMAVQTADSLPREEQEERPFGESVYESIAVAMAERKRFIEAKQVCEKIRQPKEKEDAYAAIATSLAREGQFSEAMEIVNSLRDNSSAYEDIALAQAEASQFDEAMRVARKQGKELDRFVTYALIASEMVKHNRRPHDAVLAALYTFREMRDKGMKLHVVYAYLAEAMAKDKLFAEARTMGNDIFRSKPNDPDHVIVAAYFLAAGHDFKKAVNLSTNHLQTHRLSAFNFILLQYIRATDKNGADIWDEIDTNE